MYRRILTTSVLILGVIAAVPPAAQAQGAPGLRGSAGHGPGAGVACGARDAIIAKLGDKYGEVRRGGGLSGPGPAPDHDPGAIYEIWASEATGTWTILKTTPDGLTCVMAVGEGWQDDTGEPIPVGDPV